MAKGKIKRNEKSKKRALITDKELQKILYSIGDKLNEARRKRSKERVPPKKPKFLN